jgi:hypothetical protein
MIEIALFGEDYAHETVIGALTERIAKEAGFEVELNWKSAVGGHGRVVRELRLYLRELELMAGPYPDLIVAATDANCRGLNERSLDFQDFHAPRPLVLAIPDPHIERWLLLDGSAFRGVFGRGCNLPPYKCGRDEYKELLAQNIREAEIITTIGGIEYGADLIEALDIDRAARVDDSLDRFVTDLRRVLRQFQEG